MNTYILQAHTNVYKHVFSCDVNVHSATNFTGSAPNYGSLESIPVSLKTYTEALLLTTSLSLEGEKWVFLLLSHY